MNKTKINKIGKIVISLLLILLSVTMIASTSMAVDDSVVNTGKYNPSASIGKNSSEFRSLVGNRLFFIRLIGSIISVVALIVIGIKFMLGGVEQKAEYKKRMLPYIVGMILLFGGVNLLSIIYGVVSKM